MKKYFLFPILLIALVGVFAAADTYDYKAQPDEGATYVRYSGDVYMFPDTTGNHYTEAFFIGDANQNTATVSLVCSNVAGTEDVNVFLELSHDRLNWIPVATALKDQLTTTQVYDTLNVIGGVNLQGYKNSVWARLKMDGQTGNPRTTVSWPAFLPKNTGAPTRGVAQVQPKR